ncbi:MAG: hypothetical protein HN392_00780 [Anaerolineae bacterium]|jgi:hypothetical protein|nr:hypothetical protein [Anaerolineae bacterium]MBT7075366.1 hypothetical protein [Anaerolineae bacterium]MBT7782207.1 hypothetical protein [Anaerolineae bacterium]
MPTYETTYCTYHPTAETNLRCNRCEELICSKCAVHMPTGYRCKDCIKDQKKTFNTAEWYDYIIGLVATGLLSLLASGIISAISFIAGFFMWFISIGIAGGAATLIGKIMHRLLRGRRSKNLFLASTAGIVLGALPVIIFFLLTGNYYSLIWQGIYLFVAVPAVFYNLSGFRL